MLKDIIEGMQILLVLGGNEVYTSREMEICVVAEVTDETIPSEELAKLTALGWEWNQNEDAWIYEITWTKTVGS